MIINRRLRRAQEHGLHWRDNEPGASSGSRKVTTMDEFLDQLGLILPGGNRGRGDHTTPATWLMARASPALRGSASRSPSWSFATLRKPNLAAPPKHTISTSRRWPIGSSAASWRTSSDRARIVIAPAGCLLQSRRQSAASVYPGRRPPDGHADLSYRGEQPSCPKRTALRIDDIVGWCRVTNLVRLAEPRRFTGTEQVCMARTRAPAPPLVWANVFQPPAREAEG